MMANPLVGRKFQWTWETGVPQSYTFEVYFVSEVEKLSKAIEGLEYEAKHSYDYAHVAPNVIMVSWLEENGSTLTIVINLNEQRVYGSFSDLSPSRAFMTGTIREIS